MTYTVTDGEWVCGPIRGHKVVCCDCEAEHLLDYLVIDKDTNEILNDVKIFFRAYRIVKKKKKKKKGKVK